MALQQNFRSAFNGFNREDVVHYIEQVNAKHVAELRRLNFDMQYLQDKLAQCETLSDENLSDLFPDMEQELADQAKRIAELEIQLAAAKSAASSASAASPELQQKVEAQALRIAELETQLAQTAAASDSDVNALEQKVAQQEEQIASLERQLREAQDKVRTANAAAADAKSETAALQSLLDTALSRQSHVKDQQEAELSAYRRAERVERQAKERALQINEQANGILADATAKVDEAAAHVNAVAEEVMQQIQQLQLAITDSKLVLKDTATCLYGIRTNNEEE